MDKRSISHIEIPTLNRHVSAEFYHQAFGWDYQDIQQMDYTTFMSQNVRGGFPTVNNNEVKPHDLIVYLNSDDLDADLAKIVELGGKVLSEKVEIPGVGTYVYFADPTGNRLGLWKVNRR